MPLPDDNGQNDDYFRASDSKIRFEAPPMACARTFKGRAVLLFLRITARFQRKKEERLYKKIEAAIHTGDQASLMVLYSKLADLYSAFGHTPTVLEVRKQSLRIAERLGEWPIAAVMSYYAGECAWDLGLSSESVELHKEAVELLKKAMDYAERAGDQHIMWSACERLGDLCEEVDPELSKQMVARLDKHRLDEFRDSQRGRR